MRRMRILLVALLACGLVATSAVVASAEPDQSQRLRGLGGRDFAVHVTGTLEGAPAAFGNCYTFAAGGTWIDPLFPAPGSWGQHSVGVATAYTGTASASLAPGITLYIVQEGEITPAGGSGVLQLVAHNVVFVTVAGMGDIPIGELTSVGYETGSCSAE